MPVAHQHAELTWHLAGQEHKHTVQATKACLIGRGPHCDVIIAEPTVSRSHAMIFSSGGTFKVKNVSSTNPLVLSQKKHQPLTLAHDEETAVQDEAVIYLGQAEIRLVVQKK